MTLWMRADRVLTAVLVLGAAACDPVAEIREHFHAATPREAYEHALRTAGLETTALGRDWAAAGARSLVEPVLIDAPFRETGYLSPERPGAMSYRVEAQRGQRVAVEVRLDGDTTALIFVDVFRASADTAEAPEHVVSADSGANLLEFEPRRTGSYLVRVQPELLRGGRYTVEIRRGPSLSFPVQGGSNRSIQSVFGDSRDGGRRDHHGIDIFMPRGTPVLAATEAVVSRVQQTPRGGNVVWLRDTQRGISLYYAHLDRQLVTSGSTVKPGDTLGLVGNTGNARSTPPHLHFGIYSRGEGPIDPMAWVRLSRSEPDPLRVDTSLIGEWSRASREDVRLRAAPNADAPLLAELPRHTAMLIAAATGGWYRVQLPDGRTGFIASGLLEETDRPLRRQVLASGRAVWREVGPRPLAIDTVAAGESVDVLGRFGEFLLVQAGGRAGWVTLE